MNDRSPWARDRAESSPDLNKSQFKDRLLLALGFVFVMWTVKIVELLFHLNFAVYGVYPRHQSGLKGILTMPFLHADWAHLMSNTLPAFLLILATFSFYRSVAGRVVILISVVSGFLVWVVARPSYHIGASALIYGLAAFLFLSGVFRRDRKSIAVALLVAFMYGSMVWGMLPIYPGVSWEGHLCGAVTGGFLAYVYRHRDPPHRYEWEEEELEEDTSYPIHPRRPYSD